MRFAYLAGGCLADEPLLLEDSACSTGRESFDEGDQLHAFVIKVGRALALAGTAVIEAQERLATIAAANGAPDARIVALRPRSRPRS